MSPREFKAAILAYLQASGGSCTVADMLQSCELEQDRLGISCVRWKIYQVMNALESEGVVISWMEPGVGVGIKHWRLA